MIAITQQQKEEWEAKVAELESFPHKLADLQNMSDEDFYYTGESSGQIEMYKELLSKAIVLPVEESWQYVEKINPTFLSKRINYPNGVIIKTIL